MLSCMNQATSRLYDPLYIGYLGDPFVLEFAYCDCYFDENLINLLLKLWVFCRGACINVAKDIARVEVEVVVISYSNLKINKILA